MFVEAHEMRLPPRRKLTREVPNLAAEDPYADREGIILILRLRHEPRAHDSIGAPLDPRHDPLHLLRVVDFADDLVANAGGAGEPNRALVFDEGDGVGDGGVVGVVHGSRLVAGCWSGRVVA